MEMLEKEAIIYSRRERAAMNVETECNDMIISNFVKENNHDIEDTLLTGYISEINKQNIFIILENGLGGKIPIYTLDDKLKATTRYTLKTQGHTYTIGDKIEVKISNVDIKNNEIIFEEISKKNKVRSRIKNG